ncbi:rho GTPase-activating protein gacF-like [Anopheles nili]|uniref:rho GTPase-activating protein gacF-like n=1 Tax=Anopheles nili TaxID=185578 RepID=UPI00237A1D1E|nr:rho GTPase-activating protein gacF-like [Anopheles nili]
MKQPNFSEENFQLPDRAERPSAADLRSISMRQQQQIDTQHQMLAAKEQRLRFLKSQESRNVVSLAEAERLRRLRERVEAQESKLRRLRALRGQVDLQKTYNVTLGNDLDSIRALFSEKEKELTLAVAKVEALTRQLEDLRRDRRGGGNGANGNSFNLNSNLLNTNDSPSAKEVEKLRLELSYRNQLSMQQNARLNMQREALQQRQIELHSVDKRIVELQSRINKKRILNVQNYKANVSAENQGSGQHNHVKSTSPNTNPLLHARSSSTHIIPSHSRTLSRGNIVAVEPFNHIPVKSSSLGNGLTLSSSTSPLTNINDKLTQSSSNATEVNQQQQQDLQKQQLLQLQQHQHLQLHQQYQWRIESTGNVNTTEENLLLAPESDEKKLAVRQQQQQQHQQQQQQQQQQHNRVRYNENIPNAKLSEQPTRENSLTRQISSREQQIKILTQDYEMNHRSHLPSGYNENSHLVFGSSGGTVAVEGDSNVVATDKELSNTVTNSSNGQTNVNTGMSGGTASHLQDKHQQHTSNHSKPTYNFLQNIPLGNLVVPPRKPINSVAPTLATGIKATSSASSSSSLSKDSSSAKITSVTRKNLTTTVSGVSSSAMGETDLQSVNNNSRPALPPKPNKSTGTGIAGPISGTHPCTNTANDDFGMNVENDSSSAASFDMPDLSVQGSTSKLTANDKLPIKAKPLTIRKQPFLEQPKLKNVTSSSTNNGNISGSVSGTNVGLNKLPNSSMVQQQQIMNKQKDSYVTEAGEPNISIIEASLYNNYESDVCYDKRKKSEVTDCSSGKDHPIDRLKKIKSAAVMNAGDTGQADGEINRRKRNLNSISGEMFGFSSGQVNIGNAVGISDVNGEVLAGEGTKHKLSRRVSFDPLALLLDASLEGELELVEKTAMQVTNPSAANDEGITALHNAICAGHFEIVKFLVNFGCDVNAQDSDGWTPLHCAASCNNLPMVKFLVESGACLFAATLSDHETPAEKCEEDEEGFDGCSEYLYSIQEKLGILNNGEVYAVFSYESQQSDELSFFVNDKLLIIRKGDEAEREWWWARNTIGKEGYVPRNLLGLHPRLTPSYTDET